MLEKPVKHDLIDEGYRYDFFQAVRLLERIYPERKPVGGEAMPAEEVVRFRSRVTLDFPASEIHEFRESTDPVTGNSFLEMVQNFMGMIGVSGVMPTRYSEFALDRIRHQDTTLWAFLDMFTHRIVSLFYRAWVKYRFPVAYERGNDAFTSYLFDLTGLGTRGLRGRMGLDDESLLPYTGLIGQKPHSANAVANVVGDYFGVEARVEQFFGQWLDLGPTDWTRLGAVNSQLGLNAIAGFRIWDQQSKFRIRLGPLQFKQFQGFLPNGSAYIALRSIAKFMSGDEFDNDMQLCLAAKQVPSLVLTTRAQRKPMLGWTTWLKSKPFENDDEQVVLPLSS